ncbi:ZMY12 protein, partial [Bucco capensis]|nr:ZMY12 protein [Bucco capensis]
NHQEADWVSIHQQICHLLPAIRSPLPCHLAEEERKHALEQLLKRKQHVLQLACHRAQQCVGAGKPREAIPAALQAARFSTELHGSHSLQLVPAYLLLAEAYMGVCDLLQASKYLSQAQWIVLMAPECSADLQAQLYRSLGLLCAAEGNLEQALYHLANDIYLASSTFGLKSLETSGGYFHMANIFLHQKKMDVAYSLYAKV